jgi:tetratricopeptide (TPR) repeat protein
MRGVCLLQLGEFARAAKDFGQVLNIRPDLPAAFFNRGLAHQGLAERQRAIEDFSAALKAGFPQTRVLFLRGKLRAETGDKEGAQRDWQAGLAKVPMDEHSCIARGLAQLEKDPSKALADFERAMLFNPRSRAALQNMAYVYEEILDRPQAAIDALSRLVTMEATPAKRGEALAMRGVVRARVKGFEEAVEDAQLALKLSPTDMVFYRCACVFAILSVDRPDLKTRSTDLLTLAIGKRPALAAIARDDDDLMAVRSTPAFQGLSAVAERLARDAP